jgi:hypothetical protein
MTVQEATNKMAQRRVIRVSPTLQAAATDAGDVAWNSTEIPNAVLRPGGCSRLTLLQVVNYTYTTCDFDILFTQNSATIGTVDSAVSISDDDLKTAKLLATIKYDDSESQVDGINWLTSTASFVGAASYGNPSDGILLQASENSTSVYFAGIDRTGADVDDLEFIFHIEY